MRHTHFAIETCRVLAFFTHLEDSRFSSRISSETFIVLDRRQSANKAGRAIAAQIISYCETPSAYRMTIDRIPRVRRETRPPWAVEYNRFAVTTTMTLAWHNNRRTPKALHPTAQGQRRSRATLGKQPRHPGSRTTTCMDTPKGFYKGPQSR
jgi:hypothetical protein